MKKEKPTYEISKALDLKKIIDDCQIAEIKKLSTVNSILGNSKENDSAKTIEKEKTTIFFRKLLKTVFDNSIFHPKLKSAKRILVSSLVLCCIMIISSCNQKTEDVSPKYGLSPTTQKAPVYHFAVIALHNPVKLMREYQPLIDYLNEKIPEVRFVLEPSIDYAKFEKKYKDRKPEFLLPNPWQTIQAIDSGYNVIAMAGEPKDFKGIFIVRKDSPISAPSDLKGKAVSYPSPTALAACIMPQYFLHNHGIDVNKDIKNLYVGTQESSIMNVYMKMTSAGATWPPSWSSFQKEHPKEASELKVIWETEPLINNSVMVRDDVPADIRAHVQKYLLGLHKTKSGQSIYAQMEISRFLPAMNKDYDKVRAYTARFEKEIRKVETK